MTKFSDGDLKKTIIHKLFGARKAKLHQKLDWLFSCGPTMWYGIVKESDGWMVARFTLDRAGVPRAYDQYCNGKYYCKRYRPGA